MERGAADAVSAFGDSDFESFPFRQYLRPVEICVMNTSVVKFSVSFEVPPNPSDEQECACISRNQPDFGTIAHGIYLELADRFRKLTSFSLGFLGEFLVGRSGIFAPDARSRW
ncbi:hypothetical protein MPTK1_2g24380 [Marchantia polymorpha subsp. ruderalis]|nr:hypothetical protein Mp_2g24380 [Marchantia polymorpha subsp. ruderalis]